MSHHPSMHAMEEADETSPLTINPDGGIERQKQTIKRVKKRLKKSAPNCTPKKVLVWGGSALLVILSGTAGYGIGYGVAPREKPSVPCTNHLPINYHDIGCAADLEFTEDFDSLDQGLYWKWITGCKAERDECAHLCRSWKNTEEGRTYYDKDVPTGITTTKTIPCLKGNGEVLTCKQGCTILQRAKAALSSWNATFCSFFSHDGTIEELVYPAEFYGNSSIFKEPTYTEGDVTPQCRTILSQEVMREGVCKGFDFKGDAPPKRRKSSKKPKRKRRV